MEFAIGHIEPLGVQRRSPLSRPLSQRTLFDELHGELDTLRCAKPGTAKYFAGLPVRRRRLGLKTKDGSSLTS